jgi:hypothetical protein
MDQFLKKLNQRRNRNHFLKKCAKIKTRNRKKFQLFNKNLFYNFLLFVTMDLYFQIFLLLNFVSENWFLEKSKLKIKKIVEFILSFSRGWKLVLLFKISTFVCLDEENELKNKRKNC